MWRGKSEARGEEGSRLHHQGRGVEQVRGAAWAQCRIADSTWEGLLAFGELRGTAHKTREEIQRGRRTALAT